jgi:hypothetical protein
VRRRLRGEGVLTGEDVTIDASTPSGRAYRLSLAKGDRIRFGIRCDIGDLRVINGTIGTVRGDCRVGLAPTGKRRLCIRGIVALG